MRQFVPVEIECTREPSVLKPGNSTVESKSMVECGSVISMSISMLGAGSHLKAADPVASAI